MFSEVTQPTHLFVRSDWDLALEDTQAGRISFGKLASDRRRCGGFDAITVIEDAIRTEDNSVLQLGDLRDWLPSPAKDPDFTILRNDTFALTGNTDVVNRDPTAGRPTTIGLGLYKTNCTRITRSSQSAAMGWWGIEEAD